MSDDFLKQCPFCNADMVRFGAYAEHDPHTDCVLSNFTLSAEDFDLWNMREYEESGWNQGREQALLSFANAGWELVEQLRSALDMVRGSAAWNGVGLTDGEKEQINNGLLHFAPPPEGDEP